MGNFAVNVFLSASIGMIWSLVNTLQIIVHMPLMAVSFPFNAFLLSKIFMGITNLRS